MDPSETTSHPSEPTSVAVIVEEDNGGEHKMVISVSGSPPHETKMRQISEGVHGIEMKKADPEDDGHVAASTPFPTAEDAVGEYKSSEHEGPPVTTTVSAIPDPDLAQPETASSVAEPPAVLEGPPAPSDRPKRISADYLLPFPGARRGSDSSLEQEKGLKRKLGDRAVSESRESEFVGKKASKKDVTDAATVGTKRARDEAHTDPNPKEPKRQSPPPDKIVKTEAEKPQVSSSAGVVSVCISDSSQTHWPLSHRPASWHMPTSVLSCPLRSLQALSLRRDQERMPKRM